MHATTQKFGGLTRQYCKTSLHPLPSGGKLCCCAILLCVCVCGGGGVKQRSLPWGREGGRLPGMLWPVAAPECAGLCRRGNAARHCQCVVQAGPRGCTV